VQSSSTLEARKVRQLRLRLRNDGAGFIELEARLAQYGYKRVVGVDEVGRGPLAGPVVAAAVMLDPKKVPKGLRDSKKIPSRKRIELANAIASTALAIGIGIVSAETVDLINIRCATRLAMLKALQAIGSDFDCVIVDGDPLIDLSIPVISVVGGDDKCVSVSAASIVAKVVRDRLMERMDFFYPQYNFRSNKGYGTREHIEALKKWGPSRIHRYTFEPVCQFLGLRS